LLLSGLPGQAAGESPAAPEPVISQAKAIALVTSLFGEPAGMTGPEVELQPWNAGPIWVMRWEGKGDREWSPSVSADVDATNGMILGYSAQVQRPNPRLRAWMVPEPLRYSRAEAEQIAREWLPKLAPDLAGRLRLRELPLWNEYFRLNDGGHRFDFAMTRDGYPTRRDLTLIIDARTGVLRSFGRTQESETPFLPPSGAADRATAEKAYREQFPWVLQWRQYPVGDTLEWRLVYRPAIDFYPDVSLGGRLLDLHGQPLTLEPADLAPLRQTLNLAYTKPAKPLTRDEALTMARRMTGRTDPPLDISAEPFTLGPGDKRLLWNITWGAPDNPANGVVIDSEYGLALSLFQMRPLDPGAVPGQTFTADRARRQASLFLEQVRPDLVGQLALMSGSQIPSDGNPPVYTFQWQVLRDGVPLFGRTVQVDVSAVDGAVIRYEMMPFEPVGERFAFRKPASTLTRQEAADAFLKAIGLEPAWHLVWQADDSVAYAPGWSPRLTWADAIDAGTGAPLDTSGNDIRDALLQPADIAGHPAARAISLLWSAGLLTLDHGQFRPDETAAQADLIRWLLLARGSAAPTLETALESGLVRAGEHSPADAKAAVRRDTFALWAVRAMGYGAVAEMKAPIAMAFADRTEITPATANAVALLAGLGAVGGDRFEPGRPITRGEAAQILLFVLNDHR
jgi:hypothetical protein